MSFPRSTGRFRTLLTCAAAVLLVLGAVGCGNDKDDDNNTVDPPPASDAADAGKMDTSETPADAADTAVDGTTPDGSGSDAGVDAGETDGGSCGGIACGADEVCVEDTCVPKDRAKCDMATDLGALSVGKTKSFSVDFSVEHGDALETSCGGSQEADEKVYMFQAPSGKHAQVDVQTSFQSGNGDVNLEFRQGKCLLGQDGDLGEYGTCMDTDRSVFTPQGSTWYLVVENDGGTDVTVDVELTPGAACSFGGYGDYGCKMDDRYLCEKVNDAPNEKKFACPTGCTGGRCVGDSCQNPIVIDGMSGNSGTAMSGDLAGFTGKVNFANGQDSCKVGGIKPDSFGPEVYFKIEAKKGQTIEFDFSESSISSQNDNLIYLTDSCNTKVGMMACRETWDQQEASSWTAPADGTYWLIVDKFSRAANPFEYTVTLK